LKSAVSVAVNASFVRAPYSGFNVVTTAGRGSAVVAV
jgi:hypothetical protein